MVKYQDVIIIGERLPMRPFGWYLIMPLIGGKTLQGTAVVVDREIYQSL